MTCTVPAVLVCGATILSAVAASASASSVCEPIKVDLCASIGYNMTAMPNLANNSLQADAKVELETFLPLIQSDCSPRLHFFLCSVYVPLCSARIAAAIGPCRPLCQDVRRDCTRVLEDFGYAWPKVLDCAKFPVRQGDGHICMEGPRPGQDGRGRGRDEAGWRQEQNLFNTLQTNPLFREEVRKQLSEAGQDGGALEQSYDLNKYRQYFKLFEKEAVGGEGEKPAEARCASESLTYVAHLDRCVPRCDTHFLYTEEEKRVAEILMGVFGAVCFLAALFTLVTFVLAQSRFLFPERCLAFLSVACLGLAAGHLLRLGVGREAVACPGGGGPTSLCTLTFVAVYFFSAALSSWWAVCAANWMLSAALGWRHRGRLARLAPLFHAFGWGVPAGLTVVALVLQRIDAGKHALSSTSCSFFHFDDRALSICRRANRPLRRRSSGRDRPIRVCHHPRARALRGRLLPGRRRRRLHPLLRQVGERRNEGAQRRYLPAV